MTCPICGKEAETKYRPFCSRRCADIDLGRWLTGSYAIPAGPDEEEETPPSDTSEDPSPPRPQ